MDPFKGSTHLSREPEMWTISRSLKRIAIPIALITLHSCIHDSNNSSGSAGAGAGQKAEGGEHPAAGTAFSFFSICEVDHEVKCISRRFLPGHIGR